MNFFPFKNAGIVTCGLQCNRNTLPCNFLAGLQNYAEWKVYLLTCNIVRNMFSMIFVVCHTVKVILASIADTTLNVKAFYIIAEASMNPSG